MRWRSWSWKIVVVIIVAAILFVWVMKAPVMSWYLTEKLKVPVSVGSITIWPSQTKIRNFRISNPSGFKSRSAFEAKSTAIHYQFSHLLSDPTEIDLIEIDDIFLSINCSNPLCTSNNWTAIGDNMAEEKEKAKDKPGHRVFLHKLVLTNMSVEIIGLGVGNAPETRRIDRLEFNEIDSEKGFPTEQLIRAIFKGSGLDQFIKSAFQPHKTIHNLLFPRLFGDEEEGE